MARVAARAAMEGDEAMLKKLEHVAGDKGLRRVARRATLEVAEEHLPEMQAATPVKRGHLQRSERARVLVSSKKEDIRIALLAGGPAARNPSGRDVFYAWKVHETHKTQSKFMEKLLMKLASSAAAEIGAKLNLTEALTDGSDVPSSAQEPGA